MVSGERILAHWNAFPPPSFPDEPDALLARGQPRRREELQHGVRRQEVAHERARVALGEAAETREVHDCIIRKSRIRNYFQRHLSSVRLPGLKRSHSDACDPRKNRKNSEEALFCASSFIILDLKYYHVDAILCRIV